MSSPQSAQNSGDGGVQVAIHPLRLFNDIQTRMDDELVHVLRGIREAEAGNAIAATFRGAEGDVEEGGIGGREDCEIVGHFAA